MVPAEDAASVAAAFGLGLDKNGFFIPEHEKIMPATTTTRGVYIAGTACGPKDVPQSVMQAQAAAGMALSALVPGEKISLEVATAEVRSAQCGGCRTCVGMCPYQAISFDDEKNVALVNQILCHGCGVCVSTCPAGAIENKHFTNAQIFAEIEGVLK
jgi:heterodisulfide reductase subunit A